MKLHTIMMLVAGFAALPAVAQQSNLSGTWRLNVAQSFMGGDHPFSDYQFTKKIEQKDGKLSITDTSVHANVVNIPLPDSTTTITLSADGREQELRLPPPYPGGQPSTVRASAVWQGCTLELRQFNGAAGGSTKQRLFLSDDGKQLVVLLEGHSIFHDSEQRLVFDRR